MKRTVALLLALLAAASLTACGAKGDSGASSAAEVSSQSQDTAPSEAASSEETSEPVDVEAFKAEMEALYAGTGDYKGLPVAIMETSEGTIKIRLFPEQAPKAVENFIGLAKKGYYDGLTFHRVISDFMIQGGDPKGDGTGGESFWNKPFEDEFSDLLHNFRGSLSMANAGADTNGSQFFIVQNKTAFANDSEQSQYLLQMYMNKEVYKATKQLEEAQKAGKSEEDLNKMIDELNQTLSAKQAAGVPQEYSEKMEPVMAMYKLEGGTPHLDNKHTVFGFVFEGMDVVDKIAAVETDENSKPVQSVLINKVTIEEK